MTKRINLWSSPRNVSTALMYSFAQRADTMVVDEPLYAHYLDKTTSLAVHPNANEILATYENDGNKVIENILLTPYPTKEIVLFKQMTHHLISLDLGFLRKMTNVLLIRNPIRIIASYAKVIPNPTIADIGIKMQYELFQYLDSNNHTPIVLDSKTLLQNPKKTLIKLCQRLNIPFDENMLKWEAGTRKEDGIWAKYWYATIHQSTGFLPYVEKNIKLPKNLSNLAKECQTYYNFLFENVIGSKIK